MKQPIFILLLLTSGRLQGAGVLATSTGEHSTVHLELVSPELGLPASERPVLQGHQEGCPHQHLSTAIHKAGISRMRNRKANAMSACTDWLLVASASVKRGFI